MSPAPQETPEKMDYEDTLSVKEIIPRQGPEDNNVEVIVLMRTKVAQPATKLRVFIEPENGGIVVPRIYFLICTTLY